MAVATNKQGASAAARRCDKSAYTAAVPEDGAWYVMRSGEILGRYRSLKEAKSAWDRVVQDCGWSARKQGVDAKAALRRETAERWARNRAG